MSGTRVCPNGRCSEGQCRGPRFRILYPPPTRIIEQPTAANDYTVVIDTEGLTGEVTYQWMHLSGEQTLEFNDTDSTLTGSQAGDTYYCVISYPDKTQENTDKVIPVNSEDWTSISDENGLKQLFANGGSGNLTQNIQLTEKIVLYGSSKKVQLNLNGYTLDLNTQNIELSSCMFELYDFGSGGQIINGHAEDGGAVYIYGATFRMFGGTITGCSAEYKGGAVCCQNGSFHMYGGTITGNTAYDGGGVYNNDSLGSFHMHGGTITNNTAWHLGGGVCNGESGDATFDGKCIVNNNFSYRGKDITDANKVKDNFCTYNISDQSDISKSPGVLSKGSEVWANYAKWNSQTDDYENSPGSFAYTESEYEVQYFFSDTDAYYVKYIEGENEGDSGEITLVSRLTAQPEKNNRFKVGIKMDGLTDEPGYSQPANAEADLTYQWNKISETSTELKDAGYTDGNIYNWAEGENTIISVSQYVGFSVSNNAVRVEFKCTDTNLQPGEWCGTLTRDGENYTYLMIAKDGSPSTYFYVYDPNEDWDNLVSFTITDVKFIYSTGTPISDTDARLSTGAEAGESYYCTVTFKDGSSVDSDTVEFEILPHEHDWTYTGAGNTITAKCDEDCDYSQNDFTLTLSATDADFDGQPHGASIAENSLAGQDELPEIVYYRGSEKFDAAPTEPGTYTAEITVEGAKATTSFTINAPEVKEDELKLTISGESSVCHTDIKTYTAAFEGTRPEGSYVVWDVTGGTTRYVGENLGTDSVTVVFEDLGTVKINAILVDAAGAPVKDSDGNIIEDTLEVTVKAESGDLINMILKVLKILAKLFSGLRGQK